MTWQSGGVRRAPGPRNAAYWTYQFARSPVLTHLRLARRYGDPFTLPLLDGPVLITGKPDLVQQIYGAPPATFMPFTALTPVAGESSLFVTGGARHLADRRLFAPLFHGARLGSYVPAIRDEAARESSTWSSGTSEAAFDVLAVTQRLSFAIIARVAFGMETPEEARALEGALEDMLASGSAMFLFFPVLQRTVFGRGPWATFLRARARFDALLYQAIARRRAAPSECLLSRMIELRRPNEDALSDAEIRDLLVTLLLGGFESTAIAMAWLFFAVACDEGIQERLREEVLSLPADAPWKAIDQLPFLNAVFLESSRRFPVVPQTSRRLAHDFTLGGYQLARGQSVAASLILAQGNEERFPRADHFDPSRFEGKKADTASLIPFGGGARRCIGASLAECEAKVILASFLRSHRLTAEPGPWPDLVRRTLVLGPRTPLRVRARARLTN